MSFYIGFKGSGGSLDILDENNLIMTDVEELNILGSDARAIVGSTSSRRIDLFIPSVAYGSHFNTSDDGTNAVIADVPTQNRYIPLPSAEGVPFKIGSWTNSIQPVTNSPTLTYQTVEFFSMMSNTTYIDVQLLDADDATILRQHSQVLSADFDIVQNDIRMVVTEFQPDFNKYKCKVLIEINIGAIKPFGGRFSVVISHNNESEGIFTKEQRNIFYDPNNNPIYMNGITLAESSPLALQVSGVYYYTVGSQFQVNIAQMDWLNDKSYPTSKQVEIDGSLYGLPTLNLHSVDFTGWNSNWDNQGASYEKLDWTIATNNVSTISATGSIRMRSHDWIPSGWKNSVGEEICVNTYTDNSTRILEDFRLESKRLSSTYAPWDSTDDLITYDSGTGLQVMSSRLVYPKMNFQTYKPYEILQPDYSVCTGNRYYIRSFWHTGVSWSNMIFKLSDTNITEADLTNGDCKLEISLNGLDWFLVNSLFLGGNLSNGQGCRINRDVHRLDINGQIEATLSTKFTDATTGGSWGVYVKIAYADTLRGRDLYLGMIQITNWI